MPETRFVRFTEDNEWEGESWRFWLQVDGNEAELGKLRKLLATSAEEERRTLPYRLADLADAKPEHEVDELVERESNTDYMAAHNKVAGRFSCPEGLYDEHDHGVLYKGKIARFFTQETADA